MGSWAGSRSPEFGVYPVELHFSLDSHVGPSWVVPALFNRSGWLSVAELEMETEFDRTRAVIAACINDEGEVLGQWVVEALFSMQSSLPHEVVIEPPDDLADALDALYWDFLGRCDIAHLKTLEEEERRISSAIARLELRRREVYEKVEMFLSSLFARRRRERGNDELCTMIDAKIEEVETKQAETEIWHRGRLQELQAELATFESQVLAALQNHGSLRPLYTVYWQTRHSKVRTLANTGFEMRFGLPVPQADKVDLSPIQGNMTGWRKMRLDKKRKEFDDYYAALEKKTQEHASQGQSVRKIAEALSTPRSTTPKPHVTPLNLLSEVDIPPVRARPGKQAEVAEMSRRWQVFHGSVDGVTKASGVRTKVARAQPASKPKTQVVEEETYPELAPTIFQLAGSGSSSSRQDEAALGELCAAPSEQDLVDEYQPLQELQRALQDDAMQALEQAETSGGADEIFNPPIVVLPEQPIAVAESLSRPERKTLTLSLAPKKRASEVSDPVPSVDNRTAIIQDGRRRVAESDTILLRFTDAGTGRFIRYTIRGLENDPSKGVIGTTDPRAACLIGKGVGEAVELELPTARRQAVIEKIWQDEERQPLALMKPKTVQAKQVVDVANRQVEPGDLLLFYYTEGGKRQSRYYRVPTELEMAQLPSPAPSDKRVENMLGKRVGDEIVMRVGSADRLVKIHRIMKP
ncbi:Hypothetical protein NGAL_HAMBI1146_15820 [Neorhizobium galegae bv. officinalis]|nr:Hypothetical protein NGAL_HAMBI1146_15820 [Neorhizobium galegae bv. officinalis]